MGRYLPLPEFLRKELDRIEPSDGGLLYYPCRAVLLNGQVIDRVFVEPEQLYMHSWGVWPEDDRGKRSIRIEDVARIEESPSRLPARFANELYRAGESGMGYTIFTVVFADGQHQAFGMGNAVDFVRYPDGKGPADVVAVLPHNGRNDPNRLDGPDYAWCLYSNN